MLADLAVWWPVILGKELPLANLAVCWPDIFGERVVVSPCKSGSVGQSSRLGPHIYCKSGPTDQSIAFWWPKNIISKSGSVGQSSRPGLDISGNSGPSGQSNCLVAKYPLYKGSRQATQDPQSSKS
jgi:hypothetical protein